MSKPKIMIVEDELIVVTNIEKQLKKAGYEIAATAISGEEAITKTSEVLPDLVLMDVRLAGPMDGVAAAEQIRNQYDIPVVYLTAYADDETLERAKTTDPHGYIIKPFEPNKLRSTIEIALYKHRVEKKLKESELRFRTLAASSPVGIFQTDIEGDCIYVNERWSKIAGLSNEEAQGKGWIKGLHPEDRDAISDAWYNIPKNGATFSSEYRFQTPSGKVTWVFGHAGALTDESGKKTGYIGTITDISARKKLEEEHLTLKKLEAIGILAGGIAHDFNNLLSVITGNISMLKRGDNLTPDQLSMLQSITRASSQAAELAHKLITFSKGGWLNRKRIDIEQMLKKVMQKIVPNLDAALDIKLVTDPGLLAVDGDEIQVKQVFLNLVNNAVDALKNAGKRKLTIHAQNMGNPEEDVPLSAGPYVKISIRDNGKGIDEEHLDKVFDPYFTTKPMGTQKGLGLGLTICHSIVRKHDGFIRISSPAAKEESGGTLVEVYLPAYKEDAKSKEKIAHTKSASPEIFEAKVKRVLVVDDDNIIQDVIAQMLKRLGYEQKICEEGRTAIEAYKMAKEEGKPFDVLLLDLVNKKGMGGIETIRKISHLDPDVKGKAIAISGYSDQSDLENLTKDGFIDILEKPFKWKDLKQVLEKYFQNR
jgi:PAS domain S-box-containing protein